VVRYLEAYFINALCGSGDIASTNGDIKGEALG
jgi:hypothetical protein